MALQINTDQQSLMSTVDTYIDTAFAAGTQNPSAVQVVAPLPQYTSSLMNSGLRQILRDSYRSVLAAFARAAGIGGRPVGTSNAAPSISVSAAGVFTDFDTASVSFNQALENQVVEARLNLSAYDSGPNPDAVQFRLVVDGTPTGPVYTFMFNVASTHQSMSFSWLITGSASPATHVIKVQWASVGGNTISLDGFDHWDFVVR